MNKQNKARVETIMMNAHTEGNGIKTALIPVDLCELSPIYQRDQGRHVAHIASNWDDNKAGHLEASERGDHFNIWDGGNRLRAAVMVGKTHVLCNIRTGLTDEDEAHLFVTQEENVTKLNSVYTRSGQNSTPNSNATNLHSSQKRCCSFCISSSNASPTFQVQKSIFHQMTKPIQVTVILPLLLAISFSRNDDIHSSISGISNDLIGVIPTIGQ